MINPRVTLLFSDLPAKYPRILERDYPHILNRLMQLWGTQEFDPFMHDLMVDKRGGRQGFPLEVAAELMFLSELHIHFKKKGYRLPAVEDPWKAIPVADPTPRGFLHAIERGQKSIMEIFLNAGVTFDYRFEGGQTPLMIAATNGQTGVANYLIECGAGINLRDSAGYSALHWAAFYGHVQIVDKLTGAGANINTVQNSGDTPLSLAVKRGHIDAAKLLLERQADPNIASNHGTPLHITLSRGNKEMFMLLKQFGANA
jgi:hypothetical protein